MLKEDRLSPDVPERHWMTPDDQKTTQPTNILYYSLLVTEVTVVSSI